MKRVVMAGCASYWRNSGKQILESSNQPIPLAGVNRRNGFKITDKIVQGLWAEHHATILNEIKSEGYDVIRMPRMAETAVNPANFASNVTLLRRSTLEAAKYLRARAAEVRSGAYTARGASLPKRATFN